MQIAQGPRNQSLDQTSLAGAGLVWSACRYALSSMKILLILISTIFWMSHTSACDYALPTIIPPTSPDGKFQYVYPDRGPDFRDIASSENLAVVKILKMAGEKDYPDVVIVELLHGWGYQSGRYMKYLNPRTSCGSTRVLEVGWYAAVIVRRKIVTLVPYENVEQYLKERGKPEYVYSTIGVRIGGA